MLLTWCRTMSSSLTSRLSRLWLSLLALSWRPLKRNKMPMWFVSLLSWVCSMLRTVRLVVFIARFSLGVNANVPLSVWSLFQTPAALCWTNLPPASTPSKLDLFASSCTILREWRVKLLSQLFIRHRRKPFSSSIDWSWWQMDSLCSKETLKSLWTTSDH